MKKIRTIASILLSLAMLLALMAGVAYAEESDAPNPEIAFEETVEVEQDVTAVPESVGDNDELLEEYIEVQLSVSFEPMYSVNGAGKRLTGSNLKAYNFLKEKAAKVASGEIANAQFNLTASDLGLNSSYTAEDLGVSTLGTKTSDGVVLTAEAQRAFLALFPNLSLVVRSLLFDCPYDFYWYDKAVQGACGMSKLYSCTINGSGEVVSLNNPQVTFSFSVAQEYADESGDYYIDSEGTAHPITVDSSKTGAVSTAVANIQTIVAAEEGLSDYEKLKAYKNTIDDLVDYNHDAADDDDTPYGNPWQLIWVFDDDDTTKVVCEGYSKAFQYLCDLSTFQNSNVESRIVTGTMTGGTGEGGHMWNIVTMGDRENYLVDVTNCDAGTVGEPDSLFLVGSATGSVSAGYTIPVSGTNISYKYDDNTKATYSEEELTLATDAFNPDCVHNYETIVVEPTCLEQGYTKYTCTKCGDSYIDDYQDALGHDLIYYDAQAATCEEAGWEAYEACSRCDYTTYTVIVPLGHIWQFADITFTAAAEGGYTAAANYVCENNAAHTSTVAAEVASQTAAPTCETAGTVTYTATVTAESSLDGEAHGDSKIVDGDPATGHAWSTPEYSWADDNSSVTATRVCGNDASHKETETVSTTVVVIEATETVAGSKTYTATFENEAFGTKTKVVTLPPTGYDVTIEWIEGHSKATATAVPYDTSAETITQTVDATSEITKQPTCTEEGETTYTAVFTKEVFGTYSDTVADIPAKGHSYGTPSYDWSSDNKSVTATCVCANDSSHIETETVNTTSTVTKKATCLEKGKTTYTATFTNAAFTKQTKTVENIAALGHAYKAVVTAPTCTEEGYTTHTCSRCGNSYKDTYVDAKGHTAVTDQAVAATCTQAGKTEGRHCSVCKTVLEAQKDIPAKGHTETIVKGKAATCTEKGLTDGKKCSVCGTVLEAQKDIPAKGHTAGTAVKENEKDATCTSAGSYEEVTYCSVCKAEMSRTKTAIPAAGHSWSDKWTVSEEAKYGINGEEYKACQVCGEKQTREIPMKLFADVQNQKDWFYDYVNDIANTQNSNGTPLMSGYANGSGKFGPADPLSRQDFACILYRFAEEPSVSSTRNPYPDTDTGGYYYKSILWARENNVITGYGNGYFGVGHNITREQVATILYRYARSIGVDTSVKGDLSKFSDAGSISDYAKDALIWANGAEIITGKKNGTIDPQGNAARAEIAKMILKFIEYKENATHK